MRSWEECGYVQDSEEEGYQEQASTPTEHLRAPEESPPLTPRPEDHDDERYLRDGDKSQNEGISQGDLPKTAGLPHTEKRSKTESTAWTTTLSNTRLPRDDVTVQDPALRENPADDDLSSYSSSTDVVPADAVEFQQGTLRCSHRDKSIAGDKRRSFRQRKPLQLHPYRLELEQYKQTLRSRGLQPIRVITASQQREGDESIATDDGGGIFAKDAPSSTRSATASQLSADNEQASYSFSFDPSATEAVQTKTRRVLGADADRTNGTFRSHGNKRRKIQKSPGGNHGNSDTKPEEVSDTTTDASRSHFSIFDIPPSPPTSSPTSEASTIAKIARTARQKLHTTPLRIHTPATSSAQVLTVLRPSEREGTTDQLTARVLDRSQSDDVHTPTSAELNSSDPEEDLQVYSRRIKGVLPASWLKLDQKAQGTQHRRGSNWQRENGSHNTGKGIARRYRRTVDTSARHTWSFSELQSSQENGTSTIAMNQESPFHLVGSGGTDANSPVAPLPFNVQDDDPGVAMEDDQVDSMMAPRIRFRRRQNARYPVKSRASQPIAPGRKPRQLVLTTDLQRARPRRSTFAHQIQIFASTCASSCPCPQADITPRQSQRNEQPQFLRIASRTARQRAGQGRQSPTQKSIRLQTLEDTMDANRVLDMWREEVPRAATASGETDLLPIPKVVTEQTTPEKDVADELSRIRPRKRTLWGLEAADGLRWPVSLTDKRPENAIFPRIRLASTRQLNPNFFHDVQLEGPYNSLSGKPQGVTRNSSGDELQRVVVPFATTVDRSHHTLHEKKNLRGLLQATRLHKLGTSSSSTQLPHQGLATRAPGRRKAVARRVNADMRHFRQPVQSNIAPEYTSADRATANQCHAQTLQGLTHYGPSYSIIFDVEPLPLGAYFHESTFLGSGRLETCLHMNHRDLDTHLKPALLNIGPKEYMWGLWGPDVAHDIHENFDGIVDEIDQGRGLSFAAPRLRAILEFNCSSLSFVQAVDRQNFVKSMHANLERLYERLQTNLHAKSILSEDSSHASTYLWVLTMLLCLLVQLQAINLQLPVEQRGRICLTASTKRVARSLLTGLIHDDTTWLRDRFNDLRNHNIRDAGIRSSWIKFESLVILRLILGHLDEPEISFWSVYNSLQVQADDDTSVTSSLEACWANMISVLPIFEFNEMGQLKSGSRFDRTQDNWALAVQLVHHTLRSYRETARLQGSFVNSYIRALLTRCLILVQEWGWIDCESVIGLFFDLFASNGLANLYLETVHGSPPFLEHLTDDLTLRPASNENGFHLFLKLAASGLRAMATSYRPRKVQSTAWRCIPNHGRSYPKDQPLFTVELEALRNHHDLLCTLYWASPPGFRPPVRLIQSLVDYETSHREACRLSVRSWSNMARYAAASDFSEDEMYSFASWYTSIVQHSIAQFRLARTEAELEYKRAHKEADVNSVMLDMVNKVVDRNQSATIASLAEALAGFKTALASFLNPAKASWWIKHSNMEHIFSLFDPVNSQTWGVLADMLGIIREYITCIQRSRPLSEDTVAGNEDSQDYGDWPEADDAGPTDSRSVLPHHDDFVLDRLFRMLSNVLGSEVSAPTMLCAQLIDTWVDVAVVEVFHGRREWSAFLADFGLYSWSQLRNTPLHRQFTAYFLTSVINRDVSVFEQHVEVILSAWLESLVAIGNTSSSQLRLMRAMMDADNAEPLLRNIEQFSFQTTSAISPSVLQEQRVPVLTVVFSNMKSHLQGNAGNQTDFTNSRQRSARLLRHMMAVMKSNFLELPINSASQNQYVLVVQQIIGLMQQYTFDICTVDRFFTDSVAFPLPSNDPTYVVGKLKAYAGKLSDLKTIKQFVTFVQALSERAAADLKQSHLIQQLTSAVADDFDPGSEENPSLTFALLQFILPAYVHTAFNSRMGWIFADSMMKAGCHMFATLALRISCTEDKSGTAMGLTLTRLLFLIRRCWINFNDDPSSLENSSCLRCLTNTTALICATIPSVDYLAKTWSAAQPLLRLLEWFSSATLSIADHLVYRKSLELPASAGDIFANVSGLEPMHQFVLQGLTDGLSSRWKERDGRYYFKHGGSLHEISTDLGTLREECDNFVEAVEDFHLAWRSVAGQVPTNASKDNGGF